MTVPIQAIVASAGSAIEALNNAAAARNKNKILTRGTREQDRAGMDATRTTGDFLQQLRGTAVNPAAERGLFSSALASPGVTALPTGSARFRADASHTAGAANAYGQNLADLFARIRAPQLQHQQESQLLLGLSNELRPIQARARDAQFLTELRSNTTQPNPWLGAISGMMQAGSR
jgi:hypothetical protein